MCVYEQSTAKMPPWKWELSLVPSPNVSSTVLREDDNSSFVNAPPRPRSERDDFASASFYFISEDLAVPVLGGDTLKNITR